MCAKKKNKGKAKTKPLTGSVFEGDETFAYIVGYTSGGAPYGITHEEMTENNCDEKGIDPSDWDEMECSDWDEMGRLDSGETDNQDKKKKDGAETGEIDLPF